MFSFNSNFVLNPLEKEELEGSVCICLDNINPQPTACLSNPFIQMLNDNFIKTPKNVQ